MVQLHFVPPLTALSRYKSKRELELDEQDARAHAAKISYAQSKRRLPSRGSTKVNGSISSTRNNTAEQSHRHPSSHCSGKSVSLSIVAVVDGPLDPFVQLSLELSHRDRKLLHLYLVYTPGTVYGLSPNSIFCPVRTVSIPSVASNPLFTRWIIYVSAIRCNASTTEVCTRRAGIYSDMIKMLADPANLMLDSTLMVLLVAGVAESRLGYPDLAQKHFAAGLRLLNVLRGGVRAVQSIDFATTMGLVIGFLSGDVPLFESQQAIEQALRRINVPKCPELQQRLDARLMHFLGPDLACYTTREADFHVANLHMVNMLLESRVDSRFINELTRLVLGSGEGIKPSAITYMICSCAVSEGEWYGDGAKLRTWETFEFVGLLAFAHKARADVVRAMSGWLTGMDSTDLDISIIKQEIADGCGLEEFGVRQEARKRV